jgi:hypothetical protein
MRALLLSAAIGLAAPALADQRFEATLAGHAILPAFTMALPPADAPRDALVSGKFAGPGNLRVDRPGSIMGDTGPLHGRRQTGIAVSLHRPARAGLLRHQARHRGGRQLLGADRQRLRQPPQQPRRAADVPQGPPGFPLGGGRAAQRPCSCATRCRRVPFRIAYEGTEARYLTGADLDLEASSRCPMAAS